MHLRTSTCACWRSKVRPTHSECWELSVLENRILGLSFFCFRNRHANYALPKSVVWVSLCLMALTLQVTPRAGAASPSAVVSDPRPPAPAAENRLEAAARERALPLGVHQTQLDRDPTTRSQPATRSEARGKAGRSSAAPG